MTALIPLLSHAVPIWTDCPLHLMHNCPTGIPLYRSPGDSLPWCATMDHLCPMSSFSWLIYSSICSVTSRSFLRRETFCSFSTFACQSILFIPSHLTHNLACYRNLGWKYKCPSYFWKYCQWSSSFQCCSWEIQSLLISGHLYVAWFLFLFLFSFSPLWEFVESSVFSR